MQFCVAYLEGLNHGAGAKREQLIESGEYQDPKQHPWLP
jgi:hypothetical protein